ncbi:thiamine phosphate synthase [Actinopolymorpha singaporensis]|uniref:Thiamine-phosphate pyrophosphorylase n=1 Tax=Actinopolymorpha singaporensis TaxID=117157 RepID=A0A1H1VYY7_9ACTN|nr:thiamine phosphate synthase [Actinopolymorpha singaporensis]SDS89660.1 thiamine-phosphate pyrophosphorylase [Actinopolymorpha singaporensis]
MTSPAPALPRILLLTDRTQLPPGADLVQTVLRCVRAGLRAVVLRELDLPDEARAQLAKEIRRRTTAHDFLVISAHRRLAYADGVHLSSTQPGLGSGPEKLFGRSCHDHEEVRRAVAEGAAYVTASPVAPTESKPGYGPALGVDGLHRLVREAGATPVFALGGVTAARATEMRGAGAYGIAVMGAVMRSADPAATFGRLHAAVEGFATAKRCRPFGETDPPIRAPGGSSADGSPAR